MFNKIFAAFILFLGVNGNQLCETGTALNVRNSNNCISFSVSSGTGCSWMCNYCANNLGTNNYYFTDNVCTYDVGQGTCVGNPISGKTYTCCSV